MLQKLYSNNRKKETKRIQALFENNTVSPNDYEKVIAANKVAEAKFNAAEDAFEIHGNKSSI